MSIGLGADEEGHRYVIVGVCDPIESIHIAPGMDPDARWSDVRLDVEGEQSGIVTVPIADNKGIPGYEPVGMRTPLRVLMWASGRAWSAFDRDPANGHVLYVDENDYTNPLLDVTEAEYRQLLEAHLADYCSLAE